MREDIASRLEKIREKVVANEDMFLRPCLSEEHLVTFERERDVSLPEEYRCFLKELSDGVGDVHEDDYASINEIFSLKDASAGDPADHVLGKDFPLTSAVNYEELEDSDDEDGPWDGWLELCPLGCGMSWILIVTGAERGSMWLSSEDGYFPSVPRLGFLDWLEKWADYGYSEGSEMLAFGEEGNEE